jgi:4-amino-4-deoxy-L-arabinose transferase-like glycosyltransferase
VAAVAIALLLTGLGAAPLVDPPEGFHVQVALEMARTGDWITPHINGVRYFDKPPLLYWLMAGGFVTLGVSEATARIWSALPAVGLAVTTAWLGVRLASPRVGLMAGLMVIANLELFLFGRLVKPDLLFSFLILVAFAAFLEAYAGGVPQARLLVWASLGATVLAKDVLGALGPIAVGALFFSLTGERRAWRRWVPWGGLVLALAIAVPWYVVVELRNPGFLWYTLVDNHILNFLQHRAFPDEDVPLTAAEFVAVTALGFFPWTLALPWALARAFRRPWDTPERRIWLLLALWTVVLLGFFTLSPFKLPHYGLPAFPAMALVVAKVWSDALDRKPDAPSPWTLLLPALVCLIAVAVVALLSWQGRLAPPVGALPAADVSARNLAARGQEAPFFTAGQIRHVAGTLAAIFAVGAAAMAAAAVARRPLIGLGALMATMLAFLPITVEGFNAFSKSRSVRGLADAIALAATPRDVLAHEGPLENSASWLLGLDRPVKIVNGLQSNLAVGATFPDARATFWDAQDLARSWHGTDRVFLLSSVKPSRSVVRELPADSVHLLQTDAGRWLYSNRP